VSFCFAEPGLQAERRARRVRMMVGIFAGNAQGEGAERKDRQLVGRAAWRKWVKLCPRSAM